jgi:hypothetical protein
MIHKTGLGTTSHILWIEKPPFKWVIQLLALLICAPLILFVWIVFVIPVFFLDKARVAYMKWTINKNDQGGPRGGPIFF